MSRFFLPIAQEAVFIFPVLWYNAPAPLWGRTFDFPERDHGTGTFLPTLMHWQYGNNWCGSLKRASFWITPKDEQLTAQLWTGPAIRENAEILYTAQFPISDEGLEQLRTWLLEHAAAVNAANPSPSATRGSPRRRSFHSDETGGRGPMNLNQLYYLQAIAQARGLTRAADALYVTQSNLSHSMAALEEELGIPPSLQKRAGYPAHSVRAGVPRLRRAGHPADRGGEAGGPVPVQPHPGPGTAGLHQRCQRHSDPLVRQSLLPEPGQPGYYFLPLTRNPPGASPPISPTTPWTSASAPGSTTAHLSSAPWCPRSWWPWSPPDIPWPSRSR